MYETTSQSYLIASLEILKGQRKVSSYNHEKLLTKLQLIAEQFCANHATSSCGFRG